MPGYDIYPSVDAEYNFPPEIRDALVKSDEMKNALDDSRDAAVEVVGASGSGMISMFAGSTPPPNWKICDGSAVSRNDYPQLFAAIGTTYGAGDNSTTFNIPNLKGKVVVGVDASQTEFAALSAAGGEKAHKLTAAEMPSHAHQQNAHGHGISDGGHNHSQNAHGHGVSDPGHAHNVYDPGHGHGVYDPGHGHGSTTLDGFQTYKTDLATRRQIALSGVAGSAASNVYAIASNNGNTAVDYGVAANRGTGIGINGSGTGVAIYSSGVGIGINWETASNNASYANVGVQNTTATEQNAGGDASHNNLPPYLALNYIIHL